MNEVHLCAETIVPCSVFKQPDAHVPRGVLSQYDAMELIRQDIRSGDITALFLRTDPFQYSYDEVALRSKPASWTKLWMHVGRS